MRKFKFLAIIAVVCTLGIFGYNTYSNATMTAEERLLMRNVEALTQEENWKGKNLKIVKCTCPSTGKEGDTFRCEKDGNLEPCTVTQQGSNSCYKANFAGIKIC